MLAAPGLRIVPEAWRADERAPIGTSSPVVGHDLEQEVAALPLEAFPGLLAVLFEHAVKRRMSDHQATDAASVARVNDRETTVNVIHKTLSSHRRAIKASYLPRWSRGRPYATETHVRCRAVGRSLAPRAGR